MKYWWGLIILLGAAFYFSSIFYGFSQDDFIHHNASRISTFPEFLNFFNPFHQFPDIFFYRPLATQVYFFLNSSLFGLNPIPYHLESLSLHILNGVLFYLISYKLFKDKKVALLAAVLYVTSAIHFLSLFYISSFQQLARTFFMFLSVTFYIEHIDKKRSIFLLGSVLSFIGALLSKETSIILPFLFPLIEIIRGRENPLKILKFQVKSLIPFFVVLVSYIILRIIGIQSVFQQGSYDLSFSLANALQNLKWYIIWASGLPEILATYPSLGVNSLIQFIKDFSEAKFILGALGLLILSLIIFVFGHLNNFYHVVRNVKLKDLIAYVLLFLIPLLPVLFLKGHKYPQYLDFSFIALLPLVSMFLIKFFYQKKIFASITILSILLLQFFSLKLTENTHWTTHRSMISDYYHNNITEKYKNPAENSSIVLIGNKKALDEVSHALAGKYAFLAWYPNKIKDVSFLESEEEIQSRENLIIQFVDKY